MAYTTKATTSGGRNGRAVLENGGLALAMALPKDLGGAGDGHNPEQLFALGWSACFGQAILVLAKKHGLDGQAAKASAARTFGRRNPVPPPPTERFRMIDRSPAAIVRMISMGLFWPPGYSDDPCAGVNEAIDVFSRQATNERDRRLLADAVLQRSRYCPP